MSVTVWSNNPELAGKRFPGAMVMEDNPPLDNSYDIILLDHFIQQANREQVGKALLFFRDKLKNNGQIVVIVPSLEWACRQVAIKDDAPVMAYLHLYGTKDEPHLSGLTLNWLRLACEAAGLFTIQAYSEKYIVNVNEKEEPAFQNVYIGVKKEAGEAFA